jgi:hypothetical protein
MSWLSDFAPIFGGSVTLAGAMYGACTAAEKAARPEALKDIGRILKDPSWELSARPSAIIERVFVWTFGERHLSWKCIRRSSSASVFLFAIALGILYSKGSPHIFVVAHSDPGFFLGMFILGIVIVVFPDYISLWKVRVLFKLIPSPSKSRGLIGIMAADILLSILISLFFVLLVMASIDLPLGGWEAVVHDMRTLIRGLFHMEDAYLTSAFPMTTLFTSVWTILILLSTTVLKILSPIHRFTGWFFDVDQHPLKAIGIVAGALVMLGSLVWTVIRSVI